MKSVEDQIFKKGSTTYYWSSKFFPKSSRDDVFKLYSFVRVIDDYVDASPQMVDDFHQIRKMWNLAKNNADYSTVAKSDDDIKTRIIKNMVSVSRKYEFDTEWIEAFFDSMQMDIDQKKYLTIDDTLDYVYGSAEVIGLMMAKIMRIPEEAWEAAKLQGRAMQFINFIRDIDEDIGLGRRYIPAEDMKKFELPTIDKKTAQHYPERFAALISYELDRYDEWQQKAYEGYEYIPKSLRGPLRTATDMYNWTAVQIRKNPSIIFEKKIKPSKKRVVLRATRNLTRG